MSPNILRTRPALDLRRCPAPLTVARRIAGVALAGAATSMFTRPLEAQPPQPTVYASAGVQTFGQAGCGSVPGGNGGTGFTTVGVFAVSSTESVGQTGGATPAQSACIGHWAGQASASASFGSLSAYASTAAPYRYAQGLAFFGDVLTYMPTAGQTGAGSAQVQFSVNGSYLIAASASDPIATHYAASRGVTVRESFFTLPNAQDYFAISDVQTAPVFPSGGSFSSGTMTGTLLFTWGVPFQLYVALGVAAGDIFDTGLVTGAISDASHTLILTNLEVPTGATLVAASGASYPLNGVVPGVPPTVAPEPSTSVLVFAGLGALAISQSRRRRLRA